jgi:phosphoserine phosphatase RsbU/P
MSFRAALFLFVIAIAAAVLVASMVAVTIVVGRAARSDVSAELTRSGRALADLIASRDELFAAQLAVVADEPRLKAVVAAPDVDAATIQDVVAEIQRAVGADRLVLVDADGKLVADTDAPGTHGADWSKQPAIAGALETGAASAVWMRGADDALQIRASRLAFGPTVVGVLVIGYRLDTLPAAFARETGTTLLLIVHGKPLAGSVPRDDVPAIDAGELAAIGSAEPREIELAGTRYIALASAIRGGGDLRAIMLRSLDRAMAPAHRLITTLVIVAIVTLLLAFGASFVGARALSRPLDELVALTRRIAAGDLHARTEPAGPRELQALTTSMNDMAKELGESRIARLARERLEKELEIAHRIQTSILPRKHELPGFEIAASMVAASEVGGDYYDYLPASDGCWIGIGDVAGHGLDAGLLMMMVQSTVQALIRSRPDAPPSEIVARLNAVMFENTRNRLGRYEHVTFMLARLHHDGRMIFAGAHEDIVIAGADGASEQLETKGTWVGGMADIARFTRDTTHALQAGDVVVFYTDGLIEARNSAREELGLPRIVTEVERLRGRPVAEIRDGLLDVWRKWTGGVQDDDASVIVVRYKGTA